MKNIKKFASVVLALVLIAALAACGGGKEDEKKISIAVTPVPHAEIMNIVKDKLAAQGIELEIIIYNDYVQPNKVVDSGEVYANFFQHTPYLDSFNKENGTKVVSVAKVHFEPLGLYKGKTNAVADLKDGAAIAVPNDATNEARALLLLQDQGIITLKDGIGMDATKLDIVKNEKNIEIVELDAAAIASRLADVDLAVINGNYALDAGLTTADAIAFEDPEGVAAQTYGNIVCVKEGNENTELTKALVEAVLSSEVKDFINATYGGSVIPVF